MSKWFYEKILLQFFSVNKNRIINDKMMWTDAWCVFISFKASSSSSFVNFSRSEKLLKISYAINSSDRSKFCDQLAEWTVGFSWKAVFKWKRFSHFGVKNWVFRKANCWLKAKYESKCFVKSFWAHRIISVLIDGKSISSLLWEPSRKCDLKNLISTFPVLKKCLSID